MINSQHRLLRPIIFYNPPFTTTSPCSTTYFDSDPVRFTVSTDPEPTPFKDSSSRNRHQAAMIECHSNPPPFLRLRRGSILFEMRAMGCSIIDFSSFHFVKPKQGPAAFKCLIWILIAHLRTFE